jgi:hypothetical protein
MISMLRRGRSASRWGRRSSATWWRSQLVLAEQLPDGRRDRHHDGGEDHRDHAGHVDAQRQVGLPARGHAPADHALGVLDRDPPLALLDEDDRGDDAEHDERHHHLEDLVGVVHQDCSPPGIRETIEAKIISEMPLPIPRWVISSPIHISSTVPAVSEITIRKTLLQVEVRDQRHAGLCSKLLNRKT